MGGGLLKGVIKEGKLSEQGKWDPQEKCEEGTASKKLQQARYINENVAGRVLLKKGRGGNG